MRLVCLLALLSLTAAAQNVAPEVLQLHRIKVHLLDEVSRLPNYTCLETITRFHKESSQQRLSPLDIVRLEIVYSDHREWYGSPGERKLNGDNPGAFVAGGMIGNGAFAMSLYNILAGADITFRGEEALDGRTALRYDFHLPRMLKGLMITLRGGQGTVGEEGSFWVDPRSLDLIRHESRVTEIPPYLPLRESATTVSYTRTDIGGTDALLPQSATLHLIENSGVEGYDRLDFTHCRAFSAESAIHFETEPDAKAPPESQPGAIPPSDPTEAVPAFLPVTLLLASPISDRTAVGTLIQAKVSGDVRHKGKVVVDDGATVRGRIRRLERFEATGENEFIVGLEFTEVEAAQGPLRFYADFLRIDKNSRIRPATAERIPLPGAPPNRERVLVLPELPGVASFFVSGKSFTIPTGFRMMWRTRGLIR
jgi:hypothetical protein